MFFSLRAAGDALIASHRAFGLDSEAIGQNFFVLNTPHPHPSVFTSFFKPLDLALDHPHPSQRDCCKLPDSDWLLVGILRALHAVQSGREWLQQLRHSPALPKLSRSHFFETLKSTRRLALCAEVNARLVQCFHSKVSDPLLNTCTALDGFDLYAADGHYHSSATHDQSRDRAGAKLPSGHFMRLNLRTHAIEHLCAADSSAGNKREHDMHALKRLGIAALRGPACVGRKVLYVYDRAGIDFRQWFNWKHAGGIYFISREKENMALQKLCDNSFDQADAINAGVLRDELVGSANGVQLRRVTYHDALRAESFEFITNEFTLPPGVIAHLYKMRWDIEKVFDEFKSKLGERKAWASSAAGKSHQAQFLCLAHNLMVLLEAGLEREHGIGNTAEIKRRAQRRAAENALLKKKKCVVPMLAQRVQRLTQRSLKFIRWLRYHLFAPTCYEQALALLRAEFAEL